MDIVHSRTWLTLPGAAAIGVEHGLNGVHYNNRRLYRLDLRLYLRELGLREDVNFALGDAQALGAHLELTAALLARHIEHPLRTSDESAQLQEQRGLANAGRPANEDDRAAHGPAAKHTVKLADAGGEAYLLLRVQLREQLGLAAAVLRGRGGGLAGLGLRRGLDKRVPGAAGGALARPLGRLVAALSAVE